jgi:hypothetical protein
LSTNIGQEQKQMKVRTNLYSGETAGVTALNPVEAQLNQCFQTILGLVQTANQVVNNSMTNPEALKLFTKTNPTNSL